MRDQPAMRTGAVLGVAAGVSVPALLLGGALASGASLTELWLDSGPYPAFFEDQQVLPFDWALVILGIGGLVILARGLPLLDAKPQFEWILTGGVLVLLSISIGVARVLAAA